MLNIHHQSCMHALSLSLTSSTDCIDVLGVNLIDFRLPLHTTIRLMATQRSCLVWMQLQRECCYPSCEWWMEEWRFPSWGRWGEEWWCKRRSSHIKLIDIFLLWCIFFVGVASRTSWEDNYVRWWSKKKGKPKISSLKHFTAASEDDSDDRDDDLSWCM